MFKSDRFCAIIVYPNDPSVGIWKENYLMEIPENPETLQEREKLREEIRTLYSHIYDENMFVVFSDEAH